MFKMHHANILVNKGDSSNFIYKILEEDLDFKVQANPDFLLVEVESFGIDEARDLGRWAIGKALFGEIKVCLIKTKSITTEAQNALLKTLEEPTLGTYFFISIESLGGILGTFLSRLRVLDKVYNNISSENARLFLAGNIKERLTIVSSLSKKEDKGVMRDLIKNLEEIAYRESRPTSNGRQVGMISLNHMKKILTSKIFLTSRGSSPRMILEWLSCVI